MPSAQATTSPTASLIHSAAIRLGLKAEIEVRQLSILHYLISKNKHHPKDAVGSKRVVIYGADKSKMLITLIVKCLENALLLALAQELQKLTSVPAVTSKQKSRK